MLPWAIRRRSASGAMSISWIWSAVRTTSSGTVSRCLTPVIRSTSSLIDSRCWMLTVVMTSIPAARHVRVRELVDQHDGGLAGQDRVGVHLGERRAPVVDLLTRHHFEPLEHREGPGATVGLDEPHDHVG